MSELPIVQDCSGCGACCMHMGTPPGFSAFYPPPGREIIEWARGSEDHEIWKRIPSRIRAQLRTYYERVRAGEIEDRTRDHSTPCLWFDPVTRQCRHYEHRPTVCRDFERGSIECLEHRELRGIQTRADAR